MGLESNNQNFTKAKADFSFGDIKKSIENTIINSIDKFSNGNVEILDVFAINPSLPENNWIFDPKYDKYGLFGGYQGSLNSNVEKYLQDSKTWEIVHKYYPEASCEDLELLVYRMESIGCGYMAAVNTIFQAYINRNAHSEIDFRERFGFSPYNLLKDENTGKLYQDYNYDYLFLDFFLYYAKNNYNYDNIKEVYGNVKEQMAIEGASDSALSNGDFQKTGMKETHLSDIAKVLDKYLAEKGIHISFEKNIELKPGTPEWEAKRKEAESKGLSIDDNQILYSIPSPEDIEEFLKLGKKIIMSAGGTGGFSLYYPYDKDGNGILDDIAYDDVGSHAMSIVDVTKDGKFVVSSWGHEYIFDPNVDDYQVEAYDFENFAKIDTGY